MAALFNVSYLGNRSLWNEIQKRKRRRETGREEKREDKREVWKKGRRWDKQVGKKESPVFGPLVIWEHWFVFFSFLVDIKNPKQKEKTSWMSWFHFLFFKHLLVSTSFITPESHNSLTRFSCGWGYNFLGTRHIKWKWGSVAEMCHSFMLGTLERLLYGLISNQQRSGYLAILKIILLNFSCAVTCAKSDFTLLQSGLPWSGIITLKHVQYLRRGVMWESELT